VRTRAVAERSFAALFDLYLAELHALRRSPSLLERANRVLPRLFLHLRESHVRDPRSVQAAQLVAFARELVNEDLAAATRSAYLHTVRGFFSFLVRTGVILDDPSRDLPLPHAQRLPRRGLTERQAAKLVNAPSAYTIVGRRDRAIIEMLYGTGIRRGECLRLDVTDIDLGQALVFVRDGKGKKDRIVPLAARASLSLVSYLRDSRPELAKHAHEAALFLSTLGRRLSRTQLHQMLRTHAAAARLDHVSPHALRHAYATHLLRGGASVRHVQELLGHRSLQTTALYTRVDVEDLRRVMARAHPRERAFRRRRKR
jgi:site-specific recombinase XerD